MDFNLSIYKGNFCKQDIVESVKTHITPFHSHRIRIFKKFIFKIYALWNKSTLNVNYMILGLDA